MQFGLQLEVGQEGKEVESPSEPPERNAALPAPRF